jgi:hypothetical protein
MIARVRLYDPRDTMGVALGVGTGTTYRLAAKRAVDNAMPHLRVRAGDRVRAEFTFDSK